MRQIATQPHAYSRRNGAPTFPLSEFSSVRALFGLLIAIAAVVKPPGLSESLEGQLAFWGPLEVLARYNREVCAATCLLIVLICKPRSPFFGIVGVIAFIHCMIFLKNLYYGVPEAATLLVGALTMVMAVAAYVSTPYHRANPRFAVVTPLLVASIVFAITNLVQFALDRDVTMLVFGGRFSGITSNPQMFVLCLTVIIPTMLYVYHGLPRWRWLPLTMLPVIGYFAFLTGSRLGIVLLCTSVLLFYRSRLGKLSALLSPLVAAGFLFSSFETVDVSMESRSFSLENTRSHVWKDQLDQIVTYPLFGKPLEEGERLGFAENSYLAAGASFGIVGILTMLVLAILLLKTLTQLVLAERQMGWQPEFSLCFGIVGSILVGAIFEAVLLGMFTMPLLALLQVVVLGKLLPRSAIAMSPQLGGRI